MNDNTRILVVEDDPDGQAVVAHILDYMNIAIDLVGDAEDALHHLAQHPYRAVIIDLALPGKNGWELLQHIQDDPQTQDIPCIAVTAYHTSKLREEAITAGFSAYFTKPIDATHFARQLETILV